MRRSETLATRFDPASFERRWYEAWERSGAFSPELPCEKEPFVILIPPPNVTGKLHIGHALQFTLQDLVTRWRRMQGRNALWLPGTDHAGIATQVMVERELAREGRHRHEMGREAFLERMWEWKNQYSDNICRQANALGASCDWTRERFTLDPMLSRAVRHAFVMLYGQGLIYRAHRLINWCPRCLTALSDLEVAHKEVDGGLWDFAYPLADGNEVIVSTTRPETMLGDTAIAVHPEDSRYQHLVGRHVEHPFLQRRIPVIADAELVDPAFGTGAVKVTPAHDPNDFATGERHGLERINILNVDGTVNAQGGPFAGLDRFDARKAVLNALGEKGLRRGERTHRHAVGHCQRCDTMLEPFLSLQWFLKAEPLARPALEAVRTGEVALIPDFWVATYENWLENILDWCISRQLWWGHRIPAFYCESGHTTVAEEDPAACPQCGDAVHQDEDVLDTWFSSALWPLSTLGWPEQTRDLDAFYPTTLLITGFDILFFWVARMIMMGCHFTGRAPFAHVHLTGLVRDARGQKMSKTRGNVMDPLDLVEQYGADAVRFTLAALASPGRDLPLDIQRMEGYRAFGTKLWNASRFVQMHLQGDERSLHDIDSSTLALPERWILASLQATVATVNRSWETYRFDEGCRALYKFVWNDFCDWYLEMAKSVLQGGDDHHRRAADVRSVAREVVLKAVTLLHPVMPFLTEEIAAHLGGDGMLITAHYPTAEERLHDQEAMAAVRSFQDVVQAVRSYRHMVGLSPGEQLAVHVISADDDGRRALSDLGRELRRLAGLTELTVEEGEIPAGAVRDMAGGLEFAIVLPEGWLGETQRQRIGAELAQARKESSALVSRLADEGFVNRAPSHVVEGSRQRLGELTRKIGVLAGTLGEKDVS